ncbi:MAG: hypothetical protein PQJ44_06940 [Sphaerochaetaceae bacterium]|nr:hypothetical protein [Sphaerochaetaceae bacterium]
MKKSVKKPASKKRSSPGKKFKKVMKEYSEGDLKSSSGKKVNKPSMARAIAFSEQRRADKTAKGMKYAGGKPKTKKKK